MSMVTVSPSITGFGVRVKSDARSSGVTVIGLLPLSAAKNQIEPASALQVRRTLKVFVPSAPCVMVCSPDMTVMVFGGLRKSKFGLAVWSVPSMMAWNVTLFSVVHEPLAYGPVFSMV